MYNVDTISILINFKKNLFVTNPSFYSNKKWMKITNIDKSEKVNEKIICKLVKGKNIHSWNGKYELYSFYYDDYWNCLTLNIPHSKIENNTSEEILIGVENVVMEFFGLAKSEIPDIKLSRIDIKNDYFCKSKTILVIIKYIVSRIKSKFRNYQKAEKKNDSSGYSIKYQSKVKSKRGKECLDTVNVFECFEVNETTEADTEDCTSRYIEYSFYDKEQETRFRIEKGEATLDELKKYRGIFRSEVQIKNGRLNSNYFENKQMKKTLDTYYNSEMTEFLYKKYMEQIIGPQDFYRIDTAISIIKSSNYIETKKEKLIQLINLISEVGYTEAFNIWISRYSKATFYSHLHSIESLGLNIITFPNVLDDENIDLEYIPNFTLFKNGISN